jgi:anti-anti-sigma factor
MYRTIAVERQGDVFCVRLHHPRCDEDEVHAFGNEVLSLITDQHCRKLVLILQPTPELIYSVFLAKLVMIRRRLEEVGGKLKLCEMTPLVRGVFEACQLLDHFDIAPDKATAVAAFAS